MTGPANDGLTQRTRGVAEDEIDGALQRQDSTYMCNDIGVTTQMGSYYCLRDY